MTDHPPEPPVVATPWALEGRWPTPREMLSWLTLSDQPAAEHLLHCYIADAKTGVDCHNANHRNHIAELRASEATTYERLQAERQRHKDTHTQLLDARRQIASLLSQIDARS